MDDDGDMAEMYLTEKKRRMELSFYGDQSMVGYKSVDGASISAPVSPVSSPPDSRKLEKSFSIARSRHESMRSSESTTDSIEELEMLLEAYFVVIDSTLNKLTSVNTVVYTNPFLSGFMTVYQPLFPVFLFQLKEYIDDTEDFINIQLVCFLFPGFMPILFILFWSCFSMSDHTRKGKLRNMFTKKLTMERGRSVLNFVALRLLAYGTMASYGLSESSVSYISWEEKLVSSITTNLHFILSHFFHF